MLQIVDLGGNLTVDGVPFNRCSCGKIPFIWSRPNEHNHSFRRFVSCDPCEKETWIEGGDLVRLSEDWSALNA